MNKQKDHTLHTFLKGGGGGVCRGQQFKCFKNRTTKFKITNILSRFSDDITMLLYTCCNSFLTKRTKNNYHQDVKLKSIIFE